VPGRVEGEVVELDEYQRLKGVQDPDISEWHGWRVRR
jgi:hypothetical protein